MRRHLSRLLLPALALGALPFGQPANAAPTTLVLDADCGFVAALSGESNNRLQLAKYLSFVPGPGALSWSASCWLQTVETPGVGEVVGTRVSCAGESRPGICHSDSGNLQLNRYYFSCLEYELTRSEGTYRYVNGRCTAGYYDGRGVWHTRGRGTTAGAVLNPPAVDVECAWARAGVPSSSVGSGARYLSFVPGPTAQSWSASCWLQTVETPGTGEVSGSRVDCAGAAGPGLCHSGSVNLLRNRYYFSCLRYDVVDSSGGYGYLSARCTPGYYDEKGVWHTRSSIIPVGSVTKIVRQG